MMRLAAICIACVAVHSAALAADCVTIGKPGPLATFAYRHTESTGRRSQSTHRWEELTDSGSRVRVTGPAGTHVQLNQHHIARHVVVLDKTSKLTASGSVIETTAFSPGIVSDPVLRACAGDSWPIPASVASYQSGQTRATARSPAGTLRIVSLREKVTVPAGQFDTVRYTRTSQSRDEYWKSIEHGVVVKHIGKLPNVTVTEELVSIR